ncbi:helix-turn-helix domain-containing protein [Streptomyces catenulae]|uniref:Transposase family protein n=1 Tax=Streptomyces catenulae TaxID=66875 RepID=A0ABV2YZB3_9ACTN|nr:transposase family protein [Streptomyces catenulae]
MKKAPGGRVHDQDHQSARSFRILVCPSGIDLSSRTLQHLSGLLAGHRRRIGSRWHRLTCGRQALPVLTHLRSGDTDGRLAAGFRVGIATAYRDTREAVDLLAAQAPTLEKAMTTVRKKAGPMAFPPLSPPTRSSAGRTRRTRARALLSASRSEARICAAGACVTTAPREFRTRPPGASRPRPPRAPGCRGGG